ncbi:MAG TPA: hypothetical protein VF516_10315 [Kofleriaceae bacterium]
MAALRAALGKLEPVELRDVPVSLSANELSQLALQHGVTSNQWGKEAMLDYFAQLRERNLLPRGDVLEDPAFYRDHP